VIALCAGCRPRIPYDPCERCSGERSARLESVTPQRPPFHGCVLPLPGERAECEARREREELLGRIHAYLQEADLAFRRGETSTGLEYLRAVSRECAAERISRADSTSNDLNGAEPASASCKARGEILK